MHGYLEINVWMMMLYAIANRDGDGGDIRIKHLQQHHDEQVKFDEILELMEDIKTNTKSVEVEK